MKYVNDLLSVNPEDIKHSEHERADVISIIHCPDADMYRQVVVVFSDGRSYSYDRKGVSAARMPQIFVFKPKKINLENIEIEVYKCPSCDFLSLHYDSGQPFAKTHERVIACMRCDNMDIGLWGLTTFDLKVEEGEGLE